MKRALVSLLLIFSLALPTIGAFSNEIPDEQLGSPKPPVSNEGGYSGVYFDDQTTLQRAFTFMEAWTGSSDVFSARDVVICESALEAPCKDNIRVSYETPLPPCSTERTRDCLESLEMKTGDGSTISGRLIELVEPYFGDPGSEQQRKFQTPFKGDPSRGIPDSGAPSIWRFAGVKHPGGEDFLVIPKLNAYNHDRNKAQPSYLDAGIFPVSQSQGRNDKCFISSTSGICYTRWGFPKDLEISMTLRTGANLVGWFYGRIETPRISLNTLSDGQKRLTVTGKPVEVPIVAAWAKNSELPKTLNDSIESEFVWRGNQYAGVCYFGCSSKNRADQIVNDERNPSFDTLDMFDRYLAWVKIAKDRAYANKTSWSFRSIEQYRQYEQCLRDGGFAGIVTTNSNAYLSGPPVFDGTELNYRVASPHLNSKGEVQIGTYDLSIRSDVARCIYGFTDAPIQASISILYGDGQVSQQASTVVGERDGWVYLSAKGFTYSSPVVKVKLSQEKTSAPTSSGSTTTTSPVTDSESESKVTSTVSKKKTITCVKGAKVKKITAVKPVCPKGYKRR